MTDDAINQGDTVNHDRRSARPPSLPSSRLATLRAQPGANGSGARSAVLPVARVVTVACLCSAVLAPGLASAAFTRPFLGAITTTPAGPLELSERSGLASDGAGEVWVGDGSELSEFDPSGGFLQTLEIDAAFNLAIETASGDIYVAKPGGGAQAVVAYDDTGHLLQSFGSGLASPFLAVDNSSEPSAGDVYVSHTSGVTRFSPAGAPVDFTGCGAECASYVKANEITGTPTPGGVEAIRRLALQHPRTDHGRLARGHLRAQSELQESGRRDRVCPERPFPRSLHRGRNPGPRPKP